jgi:hypothetical protein
MLLIKQMDLLFTTVIDGTLDTTTDLILIGKNYSGFGEIYNEKFNQSIREFFQYCSPK